MLLTGDVDLRELSADENVECHGVLWLLDLLEKPGCLASSSCTMAWKRWSASADADGGQANASPKLRAHSPSWSRAYLVMAGGIWPDEGRSARPLTRRTQPFPPARRALRSAKRQFTGAVPLARNGPWNEPRPAPLFSRKFYVRWTSDYSVFGVVGTTQNQ
jgi:hypothetical protein